MDNNDNIDAEKHSVSVSNLEAENTEDLISNRPEWLDIWIEVAKTDAKFFAKLG